MWSPRRLALLVVLAAFATGCEILTDFDRSLIDAGAEYDAAPFDATFPDGVAPDASGGVDASDAGATTDADATSPSSPDGEAGAPDATSVDASDAAPAPDASDANAPDTSTGDDDASDDGATE